MARTADELIQIRVSKQDKAAIRKAAESVGLTISVFMINSALIQILNMEESENVNEQK